MAATGLHISLSAEPIFNIGSFSITNSMLTSVIVSALLIIFAVVVNSSLQTTSKPKGIQNIAEWIIESLYNLVYSITGDLKKTTVFFPFIATFFLFILLNNWFGLLPGVGSIKKNAVTEPIPTVQEISHPEAEHLDVVETEEPGRITAEKIGQAEAGTKTHETVPLFRPGTADLNMTLALGLITVALTQVFGLKFLSFSYFTKYFNFSSPIMFFVGLLELVSEIGKILSFCFRLFGNIFAGEVLLAVIMWLTGLVVPMPFYALEIFVGFIQALVFAMLSLVFFNMATISHAEHD